MLILPAGHPLSRATALTVAEATSIPTFPRRAGLGSTAPTRTGRVPSCAT